MLPFSSPAKCCHAVILQQVCARQDWVRAIGTALKTGQQHWKGAVLEGEHAEGWPGAGGEQGQASGAGLWAGAAGPRMGGSASSVPRVQTARAWAYRCVLGHVPLATLPSSGPSRAGCPCSPCRRGHALEAMSVPAPAPPSWRVARSTVQALSPCWVLCLLAARQRGAGWFVAAAPLRSDFESAQRDGGGSSGRSCAPRTGRLSTAAEALSET